MSIIDKFKTNKVTEEGYRIMSFDDLKTLDSSTYYVLKSDSPNCIYKKFPQETFNTLITVTGPNTWYGRSSPFSISVRQDDGDVYLNQIKSRYTGEHNKKYFIHVLSEEDIALQFHLKNYSTLQFTVPGIHSDKLMINYSIDSKTVYPLIKEFKDELSNSLDEVVSGLEKQTKTKPNSTESLEAKYFVKIKNLKIPVSKFLSTSRSGVHRMIDSWNQIPIDKKDVSEEDRTGILSNLYTVKIVLPEKPKGIVKLHEKMKPFFEAETNVINKIAYIEFINNADRTIDSIKTSVIYNKIFESIETQEQFSAKLKQFADILLADSRYNENKYVKGITDTLSEARDIKKAAIKRKSTGAFNKIMNDLDFIEIDQTLYPLTHEAVHSGDIPLGTFFRKNGDSYFVYNDNWALWEPMLKDHREIAISIATACSGRTTYEKDIMSYFYFTLHELPEYLESQTGKKWKGIPRLVNSSNELDPPKEGDNGVAKTRSALTPIVDNENNTVTVPYVSMQIGGYQTTYCYGLSYSVLKRGFTMMGNTVMSDIEKKLNGRDDYGLMFYTLTGSSQGRGYPTFLIIFERLENSTKVHFHRTHPMRSKGGDYNPIHNWTKGCYKWMIGNVNFERIRAQQGDLAFVEIDKLPEPTETNPVVEVNAYDNHMFEQHVPYMQYTKKDNQNVLGYVQLVKDTVLSHNEHMTRIIPAGNYEIRQCRSWEANPKGIWSLRID